MLYFNRILSTRIAFSKIQDEVFKTYMFKNTIKLKVLIQCYIKCLPNLFLKRIYRKIKYKMLNVFFVVVSKY